MKKLVNGLLGLLVFVSANLMAEPQEIYWEDLVPKGYEAPEAQVNHDNVTGQQYLDAPVVSELNNQEVKIPGFIVPLEGDETMTTEFLLVPYFGACIHVPPPPPNQIIHVKFPAGLPINSLYDPIWVTGTLHTESWQGEIATVGYQMEAVSTAPFDG